jgi:hypothetical protein
MIVIHLLVLGVRGKSPGKKLMRPVLERAVKDDQESFGECVSTAIQDNPDKYYDNYGYTIAYWQVLGRCCAKWPESEGGVIATKVCSGDAQARKAYMDMAGEEGVQALCDGWCEEASADWCEEDSSSGISTGAIVGIVVGSVVVVAAIAGILVYFLVIRKRGN